MATPHVSGAAALLLAQQPGLSNDALKSILMSSVDSLPQWSGLVASGGRLNVYKAALAVAGSATGATAAFASADSLTRGTWQGVYGSDGQVIVGDGVGLPAYAAITASGQNTYIWTPSTSDVRAVQRQGADRVMAASRRRRCTGSSSTIRIVCGIAIPRAKARWSPATGKGGFKVCPCAGHHRDDRKNLYMVNER